MEAGLFVLLLIAGFATFSGLGMIVGAGGTKEGGSNVGKIIAVIVVGLGVATWLAQPGPIPPYHLLLPPRVAISNAACSPWCRSLCSCLERPSLSAFSS
jgi:hypothetical protein